MASLWMGNWSKIDIADDKSRPWGGFFCIVKCSFAKDICMIMFDEADFDYKKYGFREVVKDGVNLSFLDIKKSNSQFKKGSYRIVSCHNLFLDRKLTALVRENIKQFLKQLIKVLNIKKNANVLVCGLGNIDIMADSLGERTCKKVFASRQFSNSLITSKVCSIFPSVQAITGINTFEIVYAVAKKIKADLIILIDSLLTNNILRIGHSFQLSTVGITPGGGVRENKEICFETTSVPCISIGVPLMLDLKDISSEINKSMIVASKDIKMLVERCSGLIADAINEVLNPKLKKEDIMELINTF